MDASNELGGGAAVVPSFVSKESGKPQKYCKIIGSYPGLEPVSDALPLTDPLGRHCAIITVSGYLLHRNLIEFGDSLHCATAGMELLLHRRLILLSLVLIFILYFANSLNCTTADTTLCNVDLQSVLWRLVTLHYGRYGLAPT
jgi:hypothetical protein